MRALHFCFELHEPLVLGDFLNESAGGGEQSFRQADKEIYQPLFALLERNTQKHKQFKFSLLISGIWLDQAERYEPELVRRLKKLVNLKQVEIIVTPYYHSLAFFYNQDEFAEQVRSYREKIRQVFGVDGRIFAMPEMVYCDGLAKWVEDFGLAGMLAGGAEKVLDWRSPNHVYEVVGCEYLRVLFENEHLARKLVAQDAELLMEKKTDEGAEPKKVLSAKRFQKLLDLDCLRGGVVNLYLDAKIFADLRDVGIIAFFDELIANWLEVSGNCMVGAAEACILEEPSMEMSILQAVGKGAEIDTEEIQSAGAGERNLLPVLAEKVACEPPIWLRGGARSEAAELLYAMRKEILASEDDKLTQDFRRMMAVELQEAVIDEGLEKWKKVLDGLKRRANEAKKSQAVEISRAYTKKRDRGDVDAVKVEMKRPEPEDASREVKIVFGAKRSSGINGMNVHAGQGQVTEVPVHRLTRLAEHDEGVPEAEQVASEAPMDEPVKKVRGVRKIIRKLVIE